jgi:hypothetical protein
MDFNKKRNENQYCYSFLCKTPEELSLAVGRFKSECDLFASVREKKNFALINTEPLHLGSTLGFKCNGTMFINAKFFFSRTEANKLHSDDQREFFRGFTKE